MIKKRFDTKAITHTSIITAIMCITIPYKLSIFGPVPITLTVFVLSLLSMLFETKKMLIAILLYWFLLALGFPVAVGFQGGLSRFVSPWSGYLWMYPAFTLSEFIFSKLIKNTFLKSIFAQISALILLYIGGVTILMISAKYSFTEAFYFGVLPFLLVDTVKIFIAFIVAKTINKYKIFK